jgi:hypothetical protein
MKARRQPISVAWYLAIFIVALAAFDMLAFCPARAANVAIDPEQVQEDLQHCWIAGYSTRDWPGAPGGNGFVDCLDLAGNFHGIRRTDWIDAITTCAEAETPPCAAMLAFIKEHWGVQAALGRAR